MHQHFLRSYLDALPSISGWFSPDAALLFMAYNQLAAAHGITGDVLEIGVHHGKSAIGVAALRAPGHSFTAADLFDDLQDLNLSGSGQGSKHAFLRNMRSFHGELDFLRIFAGPSSALRPADLGGEFSFCHIDGGHSAQETYGDLVLCHQILLPGGLVALDDYFNPVFPGVCEGAVTFLREHPGALQPLAIGYNKVIFQRLPAPTDLNTEFVTNFPLVPRQQVTMWEQPAFLFDAGVAPYFDLERSTPNHLAPATEAAVGALIQPRVERLAAKPNEKLTLPVRIVNQSVMALPANAGLSYHLLNADGGVLRWDNERSYFSPALPPGGERFVEVPVTAPSAAGAYRLELDVVWEGFMWFQDQGCPTSAVDLVVS